MPSSLQAVDYAAAKQFLLAVEAVRSTDTKRVVEHLRGATLNDIYVQNGHVREDGTMIHDIYFLRVKTPTESARALDYYAPIATLRGEEALRTY